MRPSLVWAKRGRRMAVPEVRSTERNAPAARWLAVVMLGLFLLINFWDRSVLGLAGVPIMRDMRLSHAQFGLLGSAFFALFSISAIVIGRLSDRWSTQSLLAAMATVWAIAQLVPVVVMGFAAFFFSRVLLGAGEGSSFPTALHAAYNWFPDARRPLVTAVIASGAPLGVASSALVVTWIIVALGWRAAFGVLSGTTFVWAVAWLFICRVPPQKTPSGEPGMSYSSGAPRVTLISQTLIGVTAAAFAVYWTTALAVIWLPSTLEVGVRLTAASAGLVLTVAWFFQVPFFIGTGLVSESLHRRGYPTEFARGTLATGGIALSGLAMVGLALTLPTVWLTIFFVTVCLASTAITVTCVPPIIGEIAPASRRGTALGVCIAVSSLGGIIAPLAFGRIVDVAGPLRGGYGDAFLFSGAFVIVVAAVAQVLTRTKRDRDQPP